MAETDKLLLAFYGDDFTGSTDAMEFMTRAGARTVLFLEPPSAEDLEKFGKLDALGIAGLTRAMEPAKMKETLEEAFQKISELNPGHVHYKVCSTFDSSPEIGNIGVAMECGLKHFNNDFIPVLVAAPNLGRYMAFGNLFAQMGIGSKGEIFRLDKHPSMAHHPVTPSKEGDLRDHLALQSPLKSGLVDLLDLKLPFEEIQEKLRKLIDDHQVIFFDGVYEEQMKIIGRILDESADQDKPLFSVGSSGIGKALGDHWQEEKILTETLEWKELAEVKPLLVLSGSVSPVTASQIEFALENGFREVEVSPEFLYEEEPDISFYTDKISALLNEGHSVILHTSRGPEDPRLRKTRAITEEFGWDSQRSRMELPRHFGGLLGKIARQVLTGNSLQRLVIAGGDTSSYAARELGINAVEMIAPLVKGAPLCKAYAENSPVDGMEINLKGGQVGAPSYFVELQNGRLNDN